MFLTESISHERNQKAGLGRAGSLARAVVLGSALFYLLAYILLACCRIPYPFELEWMEGGSLEHVWRVLAGKPLYVAPSMDFVPFAYAPFYYYVSALCSKWFGTGFVPLRAVSFLASLGIFWLLFRLVARETNSRWAGVVTAGLFAATFRIGGAWFDLARVDSLSLLLFLLGVHVIRRGVSTRSHLLAGFLFALAFLTKQSALAMAAPVLFYYLFTDRRRFLAAAGVMAAVLGLSLILFDPAGEGWYRFYVFDFQAQRPMRADQPYWPFWSQDLFAHLPVLCLVSLIYMGLRRDAFYIWLAGGMTAAAFLARSQAGTYDNNLMPAFAALALLSGLSAPFFLKRGWRTLIFCFLLLVQFWMLRYDFSAQIPSAKDSEAGRRLIGLIRSAPGDIYLPYHGYLAAMAGKESHAHAMGIIDIVRSKREDVREMILKEIREALRAQKFTMVIMDTESNWFLEELEHGYVKKETVFDDPHVFWTRTGSMTRPESVWVPKTDGSER